MANPQKNPHPFDFVHEMAKAYRENDQPGDEKNPNFGNGVPNVVLRSAIFGVVTKGKRRQFHDKEIGCYNKRLTAKFDGPRLDQADQDVWEACLRQAAAAGSATISFKEHALLRRMDRCTGSKDVVWLRAALSRLTKSVLEVRLDEKSCFQGAMLSECLRNEVTGFTVVRINSLLSHLYNVSGYTDLDAGERRKLRGQPLAQWLHGFYSTHADPFNLKPETIMELCGSETKTIVEFRKLLRAALKKMADATGWDATIVDNKLVHVTKPTGQRPQAHGTAPPKHMGQRPCEAGQTSA